MEDIIKENDYRLLVKEQIKETMRYLIKKDKEFKITVNLEGVSFTPQLPNKIYSTLSPISLFALENYTYSTLKLHDNHISFEAGFGSQNFSSILSIPYNSIFQIIIEESMLFINLTATIKESLKSKRKEQIKNAFQKQKEKSLNSFKRNNDKLIIENSPKN